MGKGKLKKFADMAENPLVIECPYWMLKRDGFSLRGKWNESFFHNTNPIILELGCGRGEYTIGLARRFPEYNFIGVDIKGARMWHGAQTAISEGLKNVAFLRTNIEFIYEMFAPGEVSELWLTFPDPQMKKQTKRLTSTFFMQRYRKFLADGGLIHLKTDSKFMATYTKLMAEHNRLPVVEWTDDLYTSALATKRPELVEIQTYYEQMWLSRGLTIKYISFRLPWQGELSESEAEIPIDDYRSYDHEVNTTVLTRK